jgi:type III restriction enzyme
VDFWTRKDVREVVKSQVNYVVADTARWEQSAAYFLDKHKAVEAFVKNAGLGFAIPYFHNGEQHEYVPDFIVRMKSGGGSAEESRSGETVRNLILETKGFDPLKGIKRAAAERWCAAVNAHGGYGSWAYRVAEKPEEVRAAVDSALRSG